MKICNKCHLELTEGEFYKNRSSSSGLSSWCKTCSNIYVAKYTQENKGKIRAIKTKWRRVNKDQTREINQKWREKSKTKIAKSSREWSIKNHDKNLENKRKWNLENKDKINARRRQLYAKDPSVNAACVHRRRFRINGSFGSFSAVDFNLLKSLYKNTCLCCGKSEPEIKLTPDHVLPLARGGDNTIENIQPLCKSCNSKKHTKYIDYRPFIIELSQKEN